MEVKVYPEEGNPYQVEIDDTQKLKELQALVGGLIELYPAGSGMLFVFNEEGRWMKLGQNPYFPQFLGNVLAIRQEDLE